MAVDLVSEFRPGEVNCYVCARGTRMYVRGFRELDKNQHGFYRKPRGFVQGNTFAWPAIPAGDLEDTKSNRYGFVVPEKEVQSCGFLLYTPEGLYENTDIPEELEFYGEWALVRREEFPHDRKALIWLVSLLAALFVDLSAVREEWEEVLFENA